MYTPRNPIGKRKDGSFVTVQMMTKDDRGRNCKLKCPNPKCNGDFQFVLGHEDSNFEPYFRHDGKDPCNASFAFMAGLYGCLGEYLKSKNKFILPSVVIRVPENGRIDDETIIFCPKKIHDNDIELFSEKEIAFDSVETQYAGEKPIALIATLKRKKLAFVIDDIDIGCVKKLKKATEEDMMNWQLYLLTFKNFSPIT